MSIKNTILLFLLTQVRDEAGAASRADIFNPDVVDRGTAGDAG